jgi:DNA-binding winged helix-turn-helix (wHTH) protein
LARLIRFGPHVFDPATGELGLAGCSVTLRPQTALILAHLVAHAGQLVTRDELNRVLWPTATYVDCVHGINLCIHELRGLLNDDPKRPIYIETFPRRGYRFNGAVDLNGDLEPGRVDARTDAPGAALIAVVEPRGNMKVEIVCIAPQGMWLMVDTGELFVPFSLDPLLKDASINQLLKIERLDQDHLYWPLLDLTVLLGQTGDAGREPENSRRCLPASKECHADACELADP